MLKKFSGFVLASKILGAHGTLPAHRYTGVHKCAAPYSARREPRGPRWALPVERRVLAHRGLAGENNDFFEHPADDVEIFINS
jgi:hypothetical protein